jgi:hypothetical protein
MALAFGAVISQQFLWLFGNNSCKEGFNCAILSANFCDGGHPLTFHDDGICSPLGPFIFISEKDKNMGNAAANRRHVIEIVQFWISDKDSADHYAKIGLRPISHAFVDTIIIIGGTGLWLPFYTVMPLEMCSSAVKSPILAIGEWQNGYPPIKKAADIVCAAAFFISLG